MKHKSPRNAFTLLEVLMATALLAVCFVPILTSSQANVRETEQSQESLLARHFLVDLVERYRGSPVSEITQFGSFPPATVAPLGTESTLISKDPLLNAVTNIYTEMLKQTQNTGFVDPGAAGATQFVNIQTLTKITREVFCNTSATPVPVGGVSPSGPPYPPGALFQYTLTCRVRWQPRNQTSENSVQAVVILIE